MNRLILWFHLSCKRILKHPFFLFLLFLLPVGLWAFHKAEEVGTDQIAIALYTEGNEWNDTVAEELMNASSSFEYYPCSTRQELERDVMSGRAECGYIFSEDLLERLDSKRYKRSITAVISPSTVADGLASEAVFAGLFRVYGRKLLQEYLEKGEPFAYLGNDVSATWKELEPLYDAYLEGGGTFAFEYATVEGGLLEKDTVKAVFPVRGLVAVFVFVMGLAAAVTAGEDEQNGLWRTMAPDRKKLYVAAQLAASVFLACLSALASLLLTGNSRGLGYETAALLLYGGVILVFSWILLRILKNPLLLAGLIPFFIIISLIACPVFADLSVFLPALKTVRFLLPPAYYLWM